jgi:hypothetical protein
MGLDPSNLDIIITFNRLFFNEQMRAMVRSFSLVRVHAIPKKSKKEKCDLCMLFRESSLKSPHPVPDFCYRSW